MSRASLLGCDCWKRPLTDVLGPCRAVWTLTRLVGPLLVLSSQNQRVSSLSGRYRTLPNCLGLGRVYRVTTGLIKPESESSGLIWPVSDFVDRWDSARLHWSISADFGAFSGSLPGLSEASCSLQYLWVATEALLDLFGTFQRLLRVSCH